MLLTVIEAKYHYLFRSIVISDISKFWTDDYKVFEQVYGKTSDKDLYGATLPPSIGFGVDTAKKTAASEKKERFIDNGETLIDLETKLGDRYAKLYSQQELSNYEKVFQPAKSTFNFVSYSDFKPISQQSDPETYDYLKHLEQLDKEQNIEFPKGAGGFKPFTSYAGTSAKDTQAYKSIQDILDAHEGNKVKKNKLNADEEEDDVKYLNYGRYKTKKKSNTRLLQSNHISNPRCRSGRCRKRATNNVRPRSRPYIRKIQRVVGY